MDFGIKDLAVLSNGEVFAANQKLKANLNKLATLQKNLAKKVNGSNRRAKAKLKVQKLHFRIAKQLQAVLHQLSDYLTKTFSLITLEDLNVKGMVKNRKLSRAMSLIMLFYSVLLLMMKRILLLKLNLEKSL